jgi:hypothetical protein
MLPPMRRQPNLITQLTSEPLERPCAVPWSQMRGDERVRHCETCARDVYDLSAMSAREAEIRLLNAGTLTPCIRFARDDEGRVMHAAPPPGAYRPESRPAALVAAVTVGVTLGASSVRAEEPSAPAQCVAYVPQADVNRAIALAELESTRGSRGAGVGKGAGAAAGPSARAAQPSAPASGGTGLSGTGTGRSESMYLAGGPRAPREPVAFGTLRLKSKTPRDVVIVGIRLKAPIGSYLLGPGDYVAEVFRKDAKPRKIKLTMRAGKTTVIDLDKA